MNPGEEHAAVLPIRARAGGGLSDRGATGFLDFWQGEIQGSSTPKEQGQITKFLDDVRTRIVTR
jgi:hypothetical protein